MVIFILTTVSTQYYVLLSTILMTFFHFRHKFFH